MVRPAASRALALSLFVLVATTARPDAAPLPAADPTAHGDSGTLDEVLVTGERPGPGMWRVSKNGHDLWILATLEPLPKQMIWRSAAAEARIEASQVVIAPPLVTTDIGFFRGLTLLPALLRARKSPDGLTLEQALPHELYMRWLALRVKYLGSSSGSGDEQLRPMLAALDLYQHALDTTGLTDDDSVWNTVEKIARNQHVPILPVTIKLSIADPKISIKQFGAIPRNAEINCLEKTMERLETDLQPMRQRANMWSLGDVHGLQSAHYPDERLACLDAVFSVPELRDQLALARLAIDEAWLAAADAAIAKNETSFAVLSMIELQQPGGWLDKLRARGYAVQEP